MLMRVDSAGLPRHGLVSARLGTKSAAVSLAVALALIAGLVADVADCYYNATRFKKLIFHDHTNDDAVHMTPEELINRSGFRYREYYAVGHDGYITQLIRLINPKAEPGSFKRPPVLLFHGAHSDPSLFVVVSSIQHHPESWPRHPDDGPMTSANRSLGFALANRGYDVWLIGSRGCNAANSAWTRKPKHHQAKQPDFKPSRLMRAASWSPTYWNFGLDDIIKNEVPVQIELVKNVTGASELHILSYSLSTTTTMAYLAAHPTVAGQVRTYTQVAPVIAATHFNHLNRYYWEKIAWRLPGRGIGLGPTYSWDDMVSKSVILTASHSDKIRYSVLSEYFRLVFGPSPVYHTHLERNLIYHLFQPGSLKSNQHYAQSSKFGKLKRYDYGRLVNVIRYNQSEPPDYDLERLDVQNYLLISGSLDALSAPATVQRLKEVTKTLRPAEHIVAPGFNHLDLIAAVENDLYIVMPYISYLDAHSDWPDSNSTLAVPGAATATTSAPTTSTTGRPKKGAPSTTTTTRRSNKSSSTKRSKKSRR